MKAGQITNIGTPAQVLTHETIATLYGVDVTVLTHNGRPVIVDTI